MARDTVVSMSKFVFVVLAWWRWAWCAVRGARFSQSVQTMLGSETRNIMAADLTARQFNEPDDKQAVLLGSAGVEGDRSHYDYRRRYRWRPSQVLDAVPVLVSIEGQSIRRSIRTTAAVKLSPEMPLARSLKPRYCRGWRGCLDPAGDQSRGLDQAGQ